MAFVIPIFILKEYCPIDKFDPKQLIYWSGFKQGIQILFSILCAIAMIVGHTILVTGIIGNTINKKFTLYINLFSLLAAIFIFFYTQNVGKNLITITFFISFNIYSYFIFFILFFSNKTDN